MTAARPRAPIAPLRMTWAETADSVFRKGETWLRAHIDDYPDFPAPDPKTQLFRVRQVEAWLAVRHGMIPSSAAGLVDLAAERAKHGARHGAASRRQG